MIFVRDKGQMCNNVLQYAHLYAWGREHGRATLSMRFSYKYQYFAICDTRYHHFLSYLVGKWGAALHLLPVATFCQGKDNSEAEALLVKHQHIVAQGWYAAFPDLFMKYRQEIVSLFTLKASISTPVQRYMAAAVEEAQREDPRAVWKVGVHIRRGDYARWQEGRFLYSHEQYAALMTRLTALYPDRHLLFFLSTNDPTVSETWFQKRLQPHTVRFPQGTAPADLFLLSACDCLIGPPSTFSLLASLYHDLPLYRIDTPDPAALTLEAFHSFDYWFRRIL